ncbi:hypothetical protein [Methyloceanibacter methanicus]|uniref:hypothetical protein n=1 Tax=Methyloceanibacter methanicus TaxID=1774968 RepID=UPI001300DB4F|nr:hypothetical protein [Methyloceanibacter methanicus]
MQIEFMVAALRVFAAALTIGVLWPILSPIWQRTRRTWAEGASKQTHHSARRMR